MRLLRQVKVDIVQERTQFLMPSKLLTKSSECELECYYCLRMQEPIVEGKSVHNGTF
eukprot:m.76440 g.76440  ORF g.76440 m.76440 type:complete len:57 (+) comp12558_c1_seq1:1811-1981(+)